MGTAMMQGSLWGARARDYADVVERMFTPVYERVFDEVVVGVGTRLLDVGCGPGLAAHLAAKRGARVSGLDAAETSVAIARERTPARLSRRARGAIASATGSATSSPPLDRPVW